MERPQRGGLRGQRETLMDSEGQKEQAALAALEFVRSGMRLGLGTGSTVAWFLEHLGRALKAGSLTDVCGVPTSRRTEEACARLGIPVVALADHPRLDLAVDGADEVSPQLDLIKGLGGALLREKMVAAAAQKLVIIADEAKLVERLGEKSPLPVEVVRFEWRSHLPFLEDLAARPVLREDGSGQPYLTDNGNHVLDCRFQGGIADPEGVSQKLLERPGVVGHGLFLRMATTAIIAGRGGVRVLHPA